MRIYPKLRDLGLEEIAHYNSVKDTATGKFIELARKIHRHDYIYTETVFVHNQQRLKVICPIHGEFWVTPLDHIMNEQGCPDCEPRMSISDEKTREFIAKSNSLYDYKYDYSCVKFLKRDIPVAIICPEHGMFFVLPRYHVLGTSGCSGCARQNHSKASARTKDEFEQRARELHGDKYDYRLMKSYSENYMAPIICSEHGVFWLKVRRHLRGIGCEDCKIDGYTIPFIEEATRLYNGFYDYSKVVCHNKSDLVEVICPDHGSFWVSPNNHLRAGCGCALCSGSNWERLVAITLDKYEVQFSMQKKYPDCVYQRPLKFDFYLPEYECLIEVQSEHHYMPVNYGGISDEEAGEKFKIIQLKDQIKRDYCTGKDIHLYELAYWDFDKIDEKIKEFIKNEQNFKEI